MKKTKITYFKDLFNAKDTAYIVTLEKSLERIKNGHNKELIQSIRQEKDKKKRNKLKSKLPCILFAGEFQERNKSGLVSHNGLMIVDFDDINEPNYKNKLCKISHVVSVFVSPSGDGGLKCLVRIPSCDEKTHAKYYKKFIKDFNLKYADLGANDVSRVCYESYDENIYINYDAEIYEPVLIDEGYTMYEKEALIPLNDEDEIVERIMRWNWKADFVEGERNKFIFDISGAFCEFGVSESYAINYILNNVAYGDFTDREVRLTVKNVYKKRQFNFRYFEDYKKIEKVKTEIARKKDKEEIINDFNINEETYLNIKEDTDADDFWIHTKTGVKVVPNKFNNFLMRNGFRKHYRGDDDKPILVRVISNKVELTNTSKIKDFTLKYLFDRDEMEVWNYIASYQNLFSENYLNMLDDVDLIMLKDTNNTTYIAFENGILKIEKNDIKLIDYIDIEGYIWRSHILKRDFVKKEDTKNDYKQFIYNISKNNPLAIECAIGYLINTYKNRSNNKAIILNDETISQNPEGGTGKGLFFQGISHIRKTKIIDGKKYNNKSQYQNQSVDIDDKIIVFDDVPKNYNFESEFSLITEGMTIRKLYQNEIKLSVHNSPKVGITTNYAIKGQGNAHDRRRHELEVAQYYNADKTPFDEFGRELFEEWTLNEWISFDNYIVYCVQQFLKNGLIKQVTKNLPIRKFINETSIEFYDWCEKGGLTVNEYNYKDAVYNNFLEEYEDFRNYKWFTRKMLHLWVERYAKFKGYEFKGDGQYNGKRYFMLIDKNKPKNEEILF